MKIAHLNVRSMFTGFDEFLTLVHRENFDIILLTETWLTDVITSNLFNIPGYIFFRHDRAHGRGGGVGAYVNSNLSCDEITFDFEIDESIEFLFLNIKCSRISYAVGVFYRPPNSNLNLFIDVLDNIFSYICAMYDHHICMGDFNLNFFNLPNPISSCLESYNMTQVLNEPTRITNTNSTLIDPLFISKNIKLISCGTSDNNISDHRLVYGILNTSDSKLPPKFLTYRCFDNFNHQLFLEHLSSLNWNELLYESNIDRKVDILNKFIISSFDIFAPTVTRKVSKPKAPWLSPNLRLLIKDKKTALQKFKVTKNETDWLRYKQLRNLTVSLARREKKTILILFHPKKVNASYGQLWLISIFMLIVQMSCQLISLILNKLIEISLSLLRKLMITVII